MEFLSEILPIVLLFFGIVLLVVLIILGIRLIQIIDKVDRITDSVEDKINSLNGLFSVIDKATDGMARLSDKVISTISDFIVSIFNRRTKKKGSVEDE